MSMSDIQNIKDYYDNIVVVKLKGFIYGNERVERAWEEMSNWLFQSPSNILEIGCGIGDLSWRISKKYPNASVLGFDISENSIKIANQLYGKENVSFIQADNISLLPHTASRYDLIFLVDVFEHIPVGLRVNLYNFIKVSLNKYGTVFVSCPTVSHQNWLKQNKPDELQPIDEDITINEIIEFSSQINRSLLFYKEVSVWNSGDYLHVVLGCWPERFRYSDRKPMLPNSKITKYIWNKFLKLSEKRAIKMKLNYVKAKLGDEMFNTLNLKK